MCIISEAVESVAKTKILVAPNATNVRQLTVYSNLVENYSRDNAMLLPVPNPQTVEFHDLSKYKDIFTDCASCFIKPTSRRLLSNSFAFDSYSTEPKLKVFDVGSYKVSLAMNIADLKRVDKSVFSLSNGCYEMMSCEYSNPVFGFIICKLNTGSEEYHPIGYSHTLYNEKMFIPTKHYHEHTYNNLNNSVQSKPEITEDWDHEIYLYNGTNNSSSQFKNISKTNELWTGKNPIKTNLINFQFSKLAHFEKHKISFS